jgi:hypothetical protein
LAQWWLLATEVARIEGLPTRLNVGDGDAAVLGKHGRRAVVAWNPVLTVSEKFDTGE